MSHLGDAIAATRRAMKKAPERHGLSFDDAVDVAQRALPGERVAGEGWIGEDGSAVVLIGSRLAENGFPGMGYPTLAHVTPDGVVTPGKFPMFLKETRTMTRVDAGSLT